MVRIPAAAGAVLVIGALLTGCSSGSKSAAPAAVPTPASPASAATSAQPTDSASASDSPAAPTASASGAGGAVPDGLALKAFLPTAASLPAGWTLSGSGSENDTGSHVLDPGTPQLPQDSCKGGLTNMGGGSFSVDYRAAMASIIVQDQNKATVNVVVASYHPGDAAKLVAEIRTFVAGCKSYTANALGGGTVAMTATVTPVPGLGDESIDVKAVPQGQFVSQETLVTRIGDKLLLLDGSDAGGSLPVLTNLAGPLAKTIK